MELIKAVWHQYHAKKFLAMIGESGTAEFKKISHHEANSKCQRFAPIVRTTCTDQRQATNC